MYQINKNCSPQDSNSINLRIFRSIAHILLKNQGWTPKDAHKVLCLTIMLVADLVPLQKKISKMLKISK